MTIIDGELEPCNLLLVIHVFIWGAKIVGRPQGHSVDILLLIEMVLELVEAIVVHGDLVQVEHLVVLLDERALIRELGPLGLDALYIAHLFHHPHYEYHYSDQRNQT